MYTVKWGGDIWRQSKFPLQEVGDLIVNEFEMYLIS